MRSIEVEKSKIDAISAFVSGVVHSYVDDLKFEGAFVNCCANADGLSTVLLELVYIDYKFDGNNYSQEALDRVCEETGINVKVESVPYWYFGGNIGSRFDHPEVEQLKCGNIIYDRNGNLEERQRLFKLNDAIDDLEWRGVVTTEPSIQYRKEM